MVGKENNVFPDGTAGTRSCGNYFVQGGFVNFIALNG